MRGGATARAYTMADLHDEEQLVSLLPVGMSKCERGNHQTMVVIIVVLQQLLPRQT